MHLRKNGARDMMAKELPIFKRLVKSGYTDEQIGCMLGRTTRGVSGLRAHYGLTDPEKYKRTGAKYTVDEDAVINARLRDWVQVERLPSTKMAQRLRELHPPGLHYATILRRIKAMDPTGDLWREHRSNDKHRRARQLSRRHMKGGCRTQPRAPDGHYVPRERASDISH